VPGMKDTLKAASIDLFHKKGYFATSISDIARAAGIQKSSIYYHYATKEDILFDILSTTLADLNSTLQSALENVDGAENRMRAAILSHTIFHLERQKEVIIADSELRGLTAETYKSIIEQRDEYERKFQALIKVGMEAHVFHPADFKIISYAIITMSTSVCWWYRPQGRLDQKAIAEIYTDFIMTGLKGRDRKAFVKRVRKGRR
jgi:AcrR family transcriptional regulator